MNEMSLDVVLIIQDWGDADGHTLASAMLFANRAGTERFTIAVFDTDAVRPESRELGR